MKFGRDSHPFSEVLKQCGEPILGLVKHNQRDHVGPLQTLSANVMSERPHGFNIVRSVDAVALGS